MIESITINDYLDTEYLDYARYVVEERAIPSVIDGLKPTQRKIIFVSDKVWKRGNEKPLKVFQLTGKIASDANYHHGDCLDPNTEIILSDGSYITIENWFINYPNTKLKLIAYNESLDKFIEAVGHSPRIGQITDLEYEIEMEDGSIFKCTENHPFLTQRGWIEAKDLNEDDDILNLIS